MANVPIVTDLTFAELEILVAANGLEEGLQYKVTDKDWLLLATSNSALIVVSKILNINNGETIPSFIDVDEILILTETIIIDEVLKYVETVIVPINYFPTEVIINNFDDSGNSLTATQEFGELFSAVTFAAQKISIVSGFISPSYNSNIDLSGLTGNLGYIAKIKAKKYIF